MMLFLLPVLIVSLYPMWRLLGPKGDYREDLHVVVLDRRVTDNRLEILGSIENRGSTTWQRVELEAEFYDADGNFIDEESSYMSGALVSGQKENFKISAYVTNDEIAGGDVTMKIKVADADAKQF